MNLRPALPPRPPAPGFALVAVLAILALLLVLVLAISSVLHVETRTSASSKNLQAARQNALLGLHTAMSQLQEYAGKDQAVTFPATTFYPAKDVNLATAAAPRGGKGDLFDNATYGYKSKAATSSSVANGTYLTANERTSWDTALKTYWNAGRNPHWVGTMDAALRVDSATDPAAAPTALPAQRYESNPATKFGEPKRDQLPVWLVSGNEKFVVNQEAGTITDANGNNAAASYLTPNTPLPDPSSDPSVVYLVNAGSAADATTSADGLDGRVKAKKQSVLAASPAGAVTATGNYAYWVGDESTKANFAVRDRTSTNDTSYPNDVGPTTTTYRNRLQVPQRIGWENLTGFGAATFLPNDPNLENVGTSAEIGLLEDTNTAAVKAASKQNFHNLTAFSRSLLTDTALGGLKKDLTVFFEGGSASLTSSATILDRSRYNTNDPRFGAGNAGFPVSGAGSNLATWQNLLDWNDAATGTSVIPGRAPVLANFQMFFGFTYESGKVQFHVVPCVALWNPFDIPLASTSYQLKWRHNFVLFRFGIATDGIVDPTPTDLTDGGRINGGNYFLHRLTGLDWYDSTATNYKTFGMTMGGNPITGTSPNQTPNYRFSPFDRGASQPAPGDLNATWVTYEFTAGFQPGQVKVFTMGAPQKITNPSDLHTGAAVVSLVNGFDPDFPSSYYFDIASVTSPLPSAADLAAGKVRFAAELLIGGAFTPRFMSMSLATAAGTNLWRSEFLGNPGNWGRHLNFAFSPLAQSFSAPVSSPSGWRKLYDLSEWNATQKNASTGSLTAPLIAMYRGRIEPFTPSNADQFSGGIMSGKGATSYQRVFANFNLAANTSDLNLNLEGSRNADSPVNNTDQFSLNRLYFSDFNAPSSGASAQLYMGWAENASGPNNQTQLVGGDTEGFALLTWQAVSNNNKSVKGASRLPVRQATRASANLLSLGQFQQANLSKLAWQPAFPVGNSEASPYVDRAHVAGIESYTVGSATNSGNAAHASYYRPAGPMPNDVNNRLIDVSYLLNENLWDSYFLSSIPQTGALPLDNTTPLPNSRMRFLNTAGLTTTDVRNFETSAAHLENIGALNVNSTSVEAWKALLTAFRKLAFASTSDDRSTATINTSIPVSRTLTPTTTALGGGNIEFTTTSKNNAAIGAAEVAGGGRNYQKFFTGFRYLTDPMIQSFAERIVDEVRLRGPFLSLADFVNRRLVPPDGAYTTGSGWKTARSANQSSNTDAGTHSYGVKPAFFGGSYSDASRIGAYNSLLGLQGINGALQRAINLSGINGGMNYPLTLDRNDRSFRVERDPTQLQDDTDAAGPGTGNIPMQIYPSNAHYLDTEHLAGAPTGEVGQLLSHSPGFVTQGDLLAMIGPALTPRGDTFLVRSYGDSVDQNGKVLARAYLEAVVQRLPDPVTPAGTSGPDQWRPVDKFGRKFKVVKLRWLNPEEI